MLPANPPLRQWAGLRVWIAGASSGIGAALARQLLGAGARVAVSARSAERLHAAFAAAARLPDVPNATGLADRLLILPADVTDADALHAAARAIEAQWGGIDLMVAMAGAYTPMRAAAFDLAAAEQIVQVNLLGVLKLFGAVQPGFMARGNGHFCIVASVAGYGGLPNSLAYGATKAACINLAQSLWMDLRDHGIAVSVVNPGFVRTPLVAANRFPMPFIIEAEEAAGRILQGLARGSFEIHFPRAFSWLLKLLNALPHGLYLRLAKKATGA